mmetsp:Transcript_53148/g.152268  ORF Transcript_53148/g.152268 Transcript_53148/m.152268 type:complete len:231 (+) Transcript_53148:645-1337(+)
MRAAAQDSYLVSAISEVDGGNVRHGLQVPEEHEELLLVHSERQGPLRAVQDHPDAISGVDLAVARGMVLARALVEVPRVQAIQHVPGRPPSNIVEVVGPRDAHEDPGALRLADVDRPRVDSVLHPSVSPHSCETVRRGVPGIFTVLPTDGHLSRGHPREQKRACPGPVAAVELRGIVRPRVVELEEQCVKNQRVWHLVRRRQILQLLHRHVRIPDMLENRGQKSSSLLLC